LTTELPPYRGSVLEFDARAQPVGAPIALAPRASSRVWETSVVSVPAADGIVLAEKRFGGASLALFDPSRRELRWVNDRRGRLAIATVAADLRGEVTLATRFPNGMLSGRLEHYAADGVLSWERELALPPDPFLGDEAPMVVTLDRNVVMVQMDMQSPGGDMLPDGSVIAGNVVSVSAIGAGGDTRFQASLSTSVSIDEEGSAAGWSSGGNQIHPVTTSGGAIVFWTFEYRIAGRPGVAVLGAVSGDGRRCARYDWSFVDPQGVGMLAAAGNNIYMTTSTGFLRLRLPAELVP
jgi:hypothetical protein